MDVAVGLARAIILLSNLHISKDLDDDSLARSALQLLVLALDKCKSLEVESKKAVEENIRLQVEVANLNKLNKDLGRNVACAEKSKAARDVASHFKDLYAFLKSYFATLQ
ncbi:unnamed protein product [Ilex paraguariensis]|uniref:Uncharacterized protein n=1 Tax=Ilex paraguariensis TaxID=185542 RepID=A0ABC8SNA0_9AQUA